MKRYIQNTWRFIREKKKNITDILLIFFGVTLIFWGLSKKFMKSKEKKLSINNPSLISPE